MNQILITLLTVLLTACGVSHAPASKVNAFVSETQAKRAFAIIKDIHYLPTTYLKDGCYARSYYMALELAAEEIPSSNLYLLGTLKPTDEITWKYHVAPLIKVGDAEAWVLDPAFQEEPILQSDWIRKGKPEGFYKTRITAGSVYHFHEMDRPKFNEDDMLTNFADMPQFLTNDMAAACTIMFRYLSLAPLLDEEKNAKQSELLKRTEHLAREMKRLGKFAVDSEHLGWSPDSDKNCQDIVTKVLTE